MEGHAGAGRLNPTDVADASREPEALTKRP